MRKKLIEKCVPREWNVRILDDDDFWFYCGLQGILVQEVPIMRPGLSFIRRGHNVIWIREGLRGIERRFILWHELAHFWLHPPGVQFFSGFGNPVDNEANAVALCALIPLPVLLRFEIAEIAEMHDYPLSLIATRLQVYDKWGF